LDSHKLQIGHYLLTFIGEGKFFSIKNGYDYNSPYAMFSDSGQYASSFVEDNPSMEYAQSCANRARDIGQQVYDAMLTLKFTPDSLISAGQQFGKHWLKRIDLPTVSDLPADVGELCYNALEAGLFECYQKGAYTSFDYDINSAYFWSLSNIPDTRYGEWFEVKDVSADAVMGIYEGEITVTAPFHPFAYRLTRQIDPDDFEKARKFSYTPTGTWPKIMCKAQIDFLYKYKLGTYQVKRGAEWYPDKWVTPYRKMMERLYAKKQESTGIAKTVYKKSGVAVWGKTGEIRNGAFGEFFNPLTHFLGEQMPRLKVVETCLLNGTMPIAIALDGITSPHLLQNIDIGTGMGQWKLAYEAKPTISCNPDVILLETKDSEQLFTLTEGWLRSEIEANPDAQEYTMVKKSPITLGKALQENKLDQLGDIVDTRRSVNVTIESKRMFPEMPSCGRDLLEHKYSSLPLSVDMIELSNIQDEEDLTNDDDDGILSIVPDEEFDLEKLE
jgi:hypothetical protein